MKLSGKILEVFVLDREFEGLQVIDLKNWSGRGFIGYRENLSRIKNHTGLNDPSIYFLLSSDQSEESGNFRVYVGETEDFANRIGNHKSKPWWDKFVCFTSIDGSLTKAHVKYLERVFYQALSIEEVNVDIENTQPPGGAKLTNSDECFLDGFAENIYFILRTMGFDYFEPQVIKNVVEVKAVDESYTPGFRDYAILDGYKFEMRLARFDKFAYMRIENGMCILEKGSFICSSAKVSFPGHGYYKFWEKLVNSGHVKPSGTPGLLELTEDQVVEAPSKAGALAYAARINGPKYWKVVGKDKSLRELQKELIENAT